MDYHKVKELLEFALMDTDTLTSISKVKDGLDTLDIAAAGLSKVALNQYVNLDTIHEKIIHMINSSNVVRDGLAEIESKVSVFSELSELEEQLRSAVIARTREVIDLL
ncbi:MAG: hypothetical protein LBS60_09105 [Deltaproteobacteria bacterium]|jgi:hypothetical protein|nr:hypothetical protein [Deltaproteobacteria bacterium]